MSATMASVNPRVGQESEQFSRAVIDRDAPTLRERAYAALEQRISTCEFAPGMVLTEIELSTKLGIGRTPVREALQTLARNGMVTVLPRRGIQVTGIDVRRQLRLVEVRREVERLIARLAAIRATHEERQTFISISARLRDAAVDDDEARFIRLDQDLRQLLTFAARNEFAKQTLELTSGLSRRFWFMNRRESSLSLQAIVEPTAAIAEAVGEGNPDAACSASDALMDLVENFTREALDW